MDRLRYDPPQRAKQSMIPDQHVWLVWSSAFLLPWLVAYAVFPQQRKAMVWTSLITAPFGLTEVLFVPAYWSPPSLFNLARTTGFDIESFIFSFGIGGLAAVLYNLLTGRTLVPLTGEEKDAPRHKLHGWVLALPFISFPILYLLPWNPIYPAIAAMALGAVAAIWCRPDLAHKTWVGAILFVAYYIVFLAGLEWTAPGYIERVWNLDALSGVRVAGIPIEELLFAAAFGAYWSGLYEHFTWQRLSWRQAGA
jgi:lycopene cyclase-like protein